MTSLAGCSGEDFASVLRSLGYRMEKRPKPADPPPGSVQSAAPAEPAAAVEAGPVQAALVEAVSVETAPADPAPALAADAEPTAEPAVELGARDSRSVASRAGSGRGRHRARGTGGTREQADVGTGDQRGGSAGACCFRAGRSDGSGRRLLGVDAGAGGRSEDPPRYGGIHRGLAAGPPRRACAPAAPRTPAAPASSRTSEASCAG